MACGHRCRNGRGAEKTSDDQAPRARFLSHASLRLPTTLLSHGPHQALPPLASAILPESQLLGSSHFCGLDFRPSTKGLPHAAGSSLIVRRTVGASQHGVFSLQSRFLWPHSTGAGPGRRGGDRHQPVPCPGRHFFNVTRRSRPTGMNRDLICY